jgi:hypothetical protein
MTNRIENEQIKLLMGKFVDEIANGSPMVSPYFNEMAGRGIPKDEIVYSLALATYNYINVNYQKDKKNGFNQD